MNRLFLVNQKQSAQPVYSDSQINDTYEPVIFSQSEREDSFPTQINLQKGELLV